VPKPYKRNKTVGFVPELPVLGLLNQVNRLTHLKKSWAINKALEIGLPEVIRRAEEQQ